MAKSFIKSVYDKLNLSEFIHLSSDKSAILYNTELCQYEQMLAISGNLLYNYEQFFNYLYEHLTDDYDIASLTIFAWRNAIKIEALNECSSEHIEQTILKTCTKINKFDTDFHNYSLIEELCK